MFHPVTLQVLWPRLLNADYNEEYGLQRVANRS